MGALPDLNGIDVLVLFESSGTVSAAFTEEGWPAVSCDLLPTSGNGIHHQGDVYEIINAKKWKLIILHPPCTALCVSGNHVYAKGKPKHQFRLDAIAYTTKLFRDCQKASDMVCMENPVGVLPTQTDLPKPHYVQPYQFGHDASKRTGLYLWNLPPLRPTEVIHGRIVTWGGKQVQRWANQTDSGQNNLPPSSNRWQIRSKTYKGIATAMARQYGPLLYQQKIDFNAH